MANIQSAKKRMRQNAKRREANRYRRATVRTFEKKVRNFLAKGQKEEAQNAFKEFSSSIDRATKGNVLHPNKASRKKSRVARLFQKETASKAS